MTRSDATAWLGSRMPPPPQPLAARLQAAVVDASDDDVAVQLAEAALRCLRDALASGSARAAAYELLAADALLTYACEAAAEQGVDALATLTETYGPARFAALLEERQ